MQQNDRIDIYDVCWILVAGLFIFHIRIGIEKIDPTFIDWLLFPGSDYSYHHLSWEYFKDSPWSWPLGKIEGYAYPMPNSILYTDSIPLFAIFFKVFRFIVPNDFQYIGLWHACGFVLNTFFGVLFAKKIGYNKIVSWLVSIFFTCAVVFLAKFGHAALCGQWVLLWILYIYISCQDWTKYRILKHVFSVVFITSLIHPYLFFMVLGLASATLFSAYKKSVLSLQQFSMATVLCCVVGLLSWYACGAFMFEGQISEGLGKFSANLNTFINAWDVGTLGFSLPYIDPGQGEGLGYLGMGILLLLITILLDFVRQKQKFRTTPNWFFIACLLFFVFALSPKWTFGNQILIDWKYDDVVSQTFRGTGRFIWPLYYFIFYWVFKKIHSLPYHFKLILIPVSVFIQAIDLAPLWKRNQYANYRAAPLPYQQEMEALISTADKVIVYPPYAASIAEKSDYIYLINMAQKYRKPISAGYGARFPAQVGKEFRQKLDSTIHYFQSNTNDILITNVDSIELHKKLIHSLGGCSYQFERYRLYKKNCDTTHLTEANQKIKNQITQSLDDYLSNNTFPYHIGVLHQEGKSHLSPATVEYFKAMGSGVDTLAFGGSWLWVMDHQKLRKEIISNDNTILDSLSFDCIADRGMVKLQSSGVKSTTQDSYFLIAPNIHALIKRGINIFSIDSCGILKEQVLFDTYLSDQFFEKMTPPK